MIEVFRHTAIVFSSPSIPAAVRVSRRAPTTNVMTRTARTLALAFLGTAAAVSPVRGQAADADEPPRVTVLDGIYTEEQAERGRAMFEGSCGACHAPAEFAVSSFMRSWAGARAYDLYRLIRTTMPFDNPGGLEPREYADILSYILELNGFPAGEEELPGESETLKRIRLKRAPPRGREGPR